MAQSSNTLKGSTKVFLVLLRLVIGWHFLFEGLEKLNSDTWTSEPYLRESSGPLAPVFRAMAGDPLKDKLTPLPPPDGVNPIEVRHLVRFPRALAPEWDAYYQAFVARYNPDKNQRKLLDARFEQAKDQFVVWLDHDTKRVAFTSPYGPPVATDKMIPDRIRDYEAKLDEARELMNRDLPAHAHDQPFVAEVNAKIRTLKGDANRIRGELRADLDAQTKKMKDSLFELVTAGQLRLGPTHLLLQTMGAQALAPTGDPIGPVTGIITASEVAPVDEFAVTLNIPPMPGPVRPGVLGMSRLDWIDASVRYGTLAVGALLILGAFSRLACLGGAALLLLFYLAMPPLLGVPDNPKVEGHYFIINKNLVELVALLVLATVPSGRWLGLDGILYYLNPFRSRKAPRPAGASGTNGQQQQQRWNDPLPVTGAK
jgi:uncharacterized membrane protein YphA (DoxX/SURF4 family)